MGERYSVDVADDDADSVDESESPFSAHLTPVARTPSSSYNISFTVASTTVTLLAMHGKRTMHVSFTGSNIKAMIKYAIKPFNNLLWSP